LKAKIMSEVKKPITKKTEAQLKFLRDKDRVMVRGKFHFHEVPGGLMEFPFKKWKGDEVEKISLRDGEICTIPYGVATHLNHNCWYPVHQYYSDENGNNGMKVGQKIRRCSFQSLEFIDLDDLEPTKDIVTVEYTKAIPK
jgi:hypothetical protein